jgi:hypothetical protein
VAATYGRGERLKDEDKTLSGRKTPKNAVLLQPALAGAEEGQKNRRFPCRKEKK